MADVFDQADANIKRSEENIKRSFQGMKNAGLFFKKIFMKVYTAIKDKVEEKRNERVIRKLRPL